MNEKKLICCQGMAASMSNAGKSGLSVILTSKDNRLRFLLQGRVCNHEDDESFISVLQKTPKELWEQSNIKNIHPVAQIYLSFCPVCGRDLCRWLKKNKDRAMQIAETMNHLCL